MACRTRRDELNAVGMTTNGPMQPMKVMVQSLMLMLMMISMLLPLMHPFSCQTDITVEFLDLILYRMNLLWTLEGVLGWVKNVHSVHSVDSVDSVDSAQLLAPTQRNYQVDDEYN